MDRTDAIVSAIKEEPVIERHIYQHHWQVGTLVVYPIEIFIDKRVNIQIDTHRNYFDKAIKRVLAKHPDLFSDGYFCKNDDSCPAEIRFILNK